MPLFNKTTECGTPCPAAGQRQMFEGAETNNMKAAKHALYDKYGFRKYDGENDENRAMSYIGYLKQLIPNCRINHCRFLLGVIRLVKNHEIDSNRALFKLNQMLPFIAEKPYADDFDRNLNGWSFKRLHEKFEPVVRNHVEEQKAKIASLKLTPNPRYKLYHVQNFTQASNLKKYTNWCIAQQKWAFDRYTVDGKAKLFVCCRDDFRTIREHKGDGHPCDDYGLSLIEVSLYPDGSCNTIVSRWNGFENCMDEVRLSELLGRDFYKTFTPYSEKQLEVSEKDSYETFLKAAQDYVGSKKVYFRWPEYDDETQQTDIPKVSRIPDCGYLVSADVDASSAEKCRDMSYLILDEQKNPVIESIVKTAVYSLTNPANGHHMISFRKDDKTHMYDFTERKTIRELPACNDTTYKHFGSNAPTFPYYAFVDKGRSNDTENWYLATTGDFLTDSRDKCMLFNRAGVRNGYLLKKTGDSYEIVDFTGKTWIRNVTKSMYIAHCVIATVKEDVVRLYVGNRLRKAGYDVSSSGPLVRIAALRTSVKEPDEHFLTALFNGKELSFPRGAVTGIKTAEGVEYKANGKYVTIMMPDTVKIVS